MSRKKSISDTESEVGIHATSGAIPRKPRWDPPAGLKFPCPVGNHKHEVSSCAEFCNLSPADRWEKIESGRMCYTCLKPKTVRKTRKCEHRAGVPEILTCALCAAWAEPQGMTPFSIFFCRNKSHSSAQAPLSDLRVELEKYIGKLGTAVVDAKIRFSVNFFRKNRRSRGRRNRVSNPRTLDIAPTFNSQTGDQLVIQPEAVDLEITESSSYILQNIRVGKSECLVFFDSGANSHLIDGNVAVKEGLQAVSNERTRLGLNRSMGCSDLGPGGKEKYHEITALGMNEITNEFHKYDLKELNLEYLKYADEDERKNVLPKTVGGSTG